MLFPAVTAEVVDPQVVGEEEHEIRFARRVGRRGRRYGNQSRQNEEECAAGHNGHLGRDGRIVTPVRVTVNALRPCPSTRPPVRTSPQSTGTHPVWAAWRTPSAYP